jgi:hypothetical protein
MLNKHDLLRIILVILPNQRILKIPKTKKNPAMPKYAFFSSKAVFTD